MVWSAHHQTNILDQAVFIVFHFKTSLKNTNFRLTFTHIRHQTWMAKTFVKVEREKMGMNPNIDASKMNTIVIHLLILVNACHCLLNPIGWFATEIRLRFLSIGRRKRWKWCQHLPSLSFRSGMLSMQIHALTAKQLQVIWQAIIQVAHREFKAFVIFQSINSVRMSFGWFFFSKLASVLKPFTVADIFIFQYGFTIYCHINLWFLFLLCCFVSIHNCGSFLLNRRIAHCCWSNALWSVLNYFVYFKHLTVIDVDDGDDEMVKNLCIPSSQTQDMARHTFAILNATIHPLQLLSHVRHSDCIFARWKLIESII